MELTSKGKPEEIADPVCALQGRQLKFYDSKGEYFLPTEDDMSCHTAGGGG